jgi:WD40 repeat protein
LEHEEAAASVGFAPNGRELVIAHNYGTVTIWALDRIDVGGAVPGHVDLISATALSPDGLGAASGAADGSIYLWSTQTGCRCGSLDAHSKQVNSIAYSPDGSEVASGASDWKVCVWDTRCLRLRMSLKGEYPGVVHNVAYSPDGSLLSGVKTIGTDVWDTRSGLRIGGGLFVDPATVPGPNVNPAVSLEQSKWESVVRRVGDEATLAWWPVQLAHVTSHRQHKVWAGAAGNQVYIIRLEGGDAP